jgi:hypothetical protein
VRALAQSAFVDEDDGTAFFLGFFLISGQRCCFHRRIFSSSRSSVFACHRNPYQGFSVVACPSSAGRFLPDGRRNRRPFMYVWPEPQK